MNNANEYFEKNKQSWNQRVPAHLSSDFYDLKGFKEGKNSLKQIELDLLGDIKGKSILHLQCHFGMDTFSLERLGALVTGMDISDKAIDQANLLKKEIGSEATFICCNLYDLPNHLNEKFDIVFTSYGVISWLPDLNEWAGIIAHFLKPGGQFIFVEFHPVVWMFDDDFAKVGYNYFNAGPIVEEEKGTYADREAPIQLKSACWNHSIAETVNSLISNGLSIEKMQEIPYSPYNCFKHTQEIKPERYIIEHLGENIPMVYSLLAMKR